MHDGRCEPQEEQEKSGAAGFDEMAVLADEVRTGRVCSSESWRTEMGKVRPSKEGCEDIDGKWRKKRWGDDRTSV